MNTKLTLKQSRFIDEYLIDGNATRSAIAAGYSKKTAYAIGEENLRKLEIRSEIDRRRAETSARLEITREGLLNDLMDIARDNKGEMPQHAIKAIEVLLKSNGWDKPKDDNDGENLGDEITIRIVK